ncbi:hypothetical protein [Luteimonas terrae]|nr:hypothetical protein [Luteimonas terrae]
MRMLDFSSLGATASTLLGLVLFTLIAVGIRLVFMQRMQRRRERENRQINERLKTLIAAYKTLGGSFTGELDVDPRHLRDLRQSAREAETGTDLQAGTPETAFDSDAAVRRRRVRDAVEAALSDVILLGTEDQVRLAAQAAGDMVARRPVRVSALVVSLRAFIRQALDLDPVPTDLAVPDQGPVRGDAGAKKGAAQGGRGGGGGGGGGGMAGGGAGPGMGQPGRGTSETP